MPSELYSLTIHEQTGARIIIGHSDTNTSRDTGIIITRDRIADCIRSQIDKISDDLEAERNQSYYSQSWRIHNINNRLAAECVGAVIDLTAIDFTKPLASILMSQPIEPYFKQIELYFNTVELNKY